MDIAAWIANAILVVLARGLLGLALNLVLRKAMRVWRERRRRAVEAFNSFRE